MSGALRMKRLVRGRLACTNRSKGGAPFYCLQYTRKGRHVTKYVPSSEVAAYREATENYRRFMDAVDAYVEAASARTAAAAGLSFECASLKVRKPPAPVSGTSASIVELVLALDRCQLGVCTLAHLHTKGRSRAGTSVAANYAEAEEPESREDFIHKMKLAMKELAETRCWLRILGASGYIDAKRLEPLIAESLELTRMMGASVSTARSRMG